MFFELLGFEGFYKISKSGDVLSISRNGTISSNRILNHSVARNGYKKVCLRVNGKTYTKSIHRLLAIQFIDNPMNLPCVNHKDGNKLNNSLDNLEWVSYSSNSLHAYEDKLTIPARGADRSNLSEIDVLSIVKMKKDGETLKSISSKFGVSASTISDIVIGRTWSHVTGVKFKPSSGKGKKPKSGESGIRASHNGKYDVSCFFNGKNTYLIRIDEISSAIKARDMAREMIESGKTIQQVVSALRSVFKPQ